MAVTLGVDCKAYYATAGIGGTPTWVEIPIISEVKVPMAHGEATLKDRSSGYVRYGAAFKDISASFRLTRKLADSVYEALRDAWINKTVLGFAFAGGAIATSGVESVRYDGQVFQFDLNEADEEFSFVDVTVKPAANSTNTPAYSETV